MRARRFILTGDSFTHGNKISLKAKSFKLYLSCFLWNLYRFILANKQNIFEDSGCVAQLVEWSLLTPEVGGSNPPIGKLLLHCLLSTVLKRRKEKEAGYGPFFKNTTLSMLMEKLAFCFYCFQNNFLGEKLSFIDGAETFEIKINTVFSFSI